MVSYNSIIQEINELPLDKLSEVYDYVHSLNTNEEKVVKENNSIMSFAGLFSDMSDSDYNDFKNETVKVRKELFNRK